MERKFEASKLLGNVEDKAVKHLLEKNPKAVALADKLSDLGKQMNKCKWKVIQCKFLPKLLFL